MNDKSMDCTICMMEPKLPAPQVPVVPELECDGGCGGYGGAMIENFRGGGRRRRGSWGRGYRNWRGGYGGYGYTPYWYNPYSYWPDYYEYPYVSTPPVINKVISPGYIGVSTLNYILLFIAMILAYFALRK